MRPGKPSGTPMIDLTARYPRRQSQNHHRQWIPRHGAQEFRRFLDTAETNVPVADLDIDVVMERTGAANLAMPRRIAAIHAKTADWEIDVRSDKSAASKFWLSCRMP